MNTNDILESLAELEQNLKEINSAKEQVESVIANNKDFANSTNDLIKNTQSLIVEIKNATDSTIGQFAKKLAESKNAVDTVVKDSIDSIEISIKKVEEANLKLQETTETKVNELSSLTKKQAETVVSQSLITISDSSKLAKSTLEELKTENFKILSQFSEQLIETKSNLSILFEQSKNDIEQVNNSLQENATSKIIELSNLATKSIEEQKTENLKTLNQILETHNHIKQLIEQLLDLNLPNTLKSLNSNFEKLQEQSDRRYSEIEMQNAQIAKSIKINRIISISGILAVLSLLIFSFL